MRAVKLAAVTSGHVTKMARYSIRSSVGENPAARTTFK